MYFGIIKSLFINHNGVCAVCKGINVKISESGVCIWNFIKSNETHILHKPPVQRYTLFIIYSWSIFYSFDKNIGNCT
jgi:hypothetical protein